MKSRSPSASGSPRRRSGRWAQPTGAFSVSDTGVLVYQSTASAGSQLVWFDRAGKPVGVLGDPADYADVFLSPDGLHASASVAAPGGTRDIWTFDVARNLRTRFTFDPGNEYEGIWTPDNSRIAFNSSRGRTAESLRQIGRWDRPRGAAGRG